MVDFKVLIDDRFITHVADKSLVQIENKKILSFINDFEETKWQSENFDNFIWDNIQLTALSAGEREKLINKGHSALKAAAKNLRLTDTHSDPNEGSEIAEIILYGIMQHHFNALPVVPKIFYKQNRNDYAKGADSVHIVIKSETEYTLWYGESKFYNTIEDSRLGKIIESVENSLDKEKLKKENTIITNITDLDGLISNKELLGSIKESLKNNNSIDHLKAIINIPILLLHECSITASETSLNAKYLEKIHQYHIDRANSYFKKQITKLSGKIDKYSEINFHLILFPVNNKKEIVDRFTTFAKALREI